MAWFRAKAASSSFTVDSVPHGVACANPLPFQPGLDAGSSSSQAGADSPFSVTLSREDGNQNLAGLTIHMPLGLLGSWHQRRLPGIPGDVCDVRRREPDRATAASVGLPDRYTISGGSVFIRAPMRVHPDGLSHCSARKGGPL